MKILSYRNDRVTHATLKLGKELKHAKLRKIRKIPGHAKPDRNTVYYTELPYRTSILCPYCAYIAYIGSEGSNHAYCLYIWDFFCLCPYAV